MDTFLPFAHISTDTIGGAVSISQYIQENIVTLLIAAVVFGIAITILRSFLKIIFFIPIFLVIVVAVLWILNYFHDTPATIPNDTMPVWQPIESLD